MNKRGEKKGQHERKFRTTVNASIPGGGVGGSRISLLMLWDSLSNQSDLCSKQEGQASS